MSISRSVKKSLARFIERFRGGKRGASARLMAAAGTDGRPVMDMLEPRQLLFTMTITDNDLISADVGQVRAFFAYAAPYLDSPSDVADNEPQIVDENFDDEFPVAQGQGLPPVQNLPNNQLLLQSNIRVRHNVGVANNVQIEARLNDQGEPDSDRRARVRLNVGEYFGFRPENATGTRIAVASMNFDIEPGPNSTVGINGANMAVQLYFRGELIEQTTGAALLAKNTTNPGSGVGRFVFNAPAASAAFDELRIFALNGPNDSFFMDNVQESIPAGRFAEIVNNRIRGAEIWLAGPVGTSLSISDLYGRDMLQTLAMGKPEGLELTLVDIDDNGIPNFNDGIGKIVINNSGPSVSVSMWGGVVTPFTGTPDPNAEFSIGGFQYIRSESVAGNLSEFEASAGFGYEYDPVNGTVGGLPNSGGTIIIGSPFIRDLNSYNPGGRPTGTGNTVRTGFVNPNQGIFVTGGKSIGSVSVNAALHGSSNFSGSVGSLNIGYMVGSATVAGDLGSLVVQTEAGRWSDDLGLSLTSPHFKTGSQLIVGRTLGEVVIGGRSLLDITVSGNLSDPNAHPARDVFNYAESEFVFGIDPANAEGDEASIQANLQNTGLSGLNGIFGFRATAQSPWLGNGFRRNDSLMSAEWVGNAGSGVRIYGDLSGQDPVNTGDDNVDVYAFATDGVTPISVQVQDPTTATNFTYFRLVDAHGRTVATPGNVRGVGDLTFLTYQPNEPGVLYLVLSDPSDAPADTGTGSFSYTATILGMAPSVFGSYRTVGTSGAAGGVNTTVDIGLSQSINVLNGGIGSIRVGTGMFSSGGGEVSAQDYVNTADGDDDYLNWGGGTWGIQGGIWNISLGSDIQASLTVPLTITTGGDLGQLITGLSGLTGIAPTEGDVNFVNFYIGGRIGSLDISGGIGVDQDASPVEVGSLASTQIKTGLKTGKGDIGMIRLGSHIYGDSLSITTPTGAVVGALLVSQDIAAGGGAREGIYWGDDGVPMNLGAGSDVRFVDTPRLDLRSTVDADFTLARNVAQEFVDDGGGTVRVRLVGSPTDAPIGRVIAIPVNGSQGVAIAQIIVDLSGGGSLEIDSGTTGSASDVISIGRIIVLGAATNSNITIKGNVQVDVLRIDSTAALVAISNSTPGGDIVAIDVAGLTASAANGTGSVALEITKGNLGRTEVPAFGPQLIGPFMGLAGTGSGSTIAAPTLTGLLDTDYNGQGLRPIGDSSSAAGNAYLDDIGSPFDPWLNGLIVRGGNVDAEINISGKMGDVLVVGGSLNGRIHANSDRSTGLGQFDGIVGTIYASGTINDIDIGDGLAANTSGAMANAGIFAGNDIGLIHNDNSKVADIRGPIGASNVTNDFLDGDPVNTDGVGEVRLKGGGDIIGAYIGAMNLDNFWSSFQFGDDNIAVGDVRLVNGDKADLLRSEVNGRRLTSINLKDGYYDATRTSFTSTIGTITAKGYRNSTLVGGDLEFRINSIQTGLDLGSLLTQDATGEINDLLVDVVGSVTGRISAKNMSRVDIGVDNTITQLRVTGDMRASVVNAGRLPSITIDGNLTASHISCAGALDNLTVGDSIVNSEVSVNGPFGKIVKLVAKNNISGSISSSGPITTIEATNGDIDAAIKTLGVKSNITTIKAGRDAILDTDIAGTVDSIVAGRHIGKKGRAGAIVIRGTLKEATAGGALYSDLRVGQEITKVSISRVSSKPTNNLTSTGSIVAFGAIKAIAIAGDFDGDIISYSNGIDSIVITSGSFLPGNTIAAYDGHINSVTIDGGNLYGDIHADWILYAVNVLATADGVFGDIGVNASMSSNVAADDYRNQLPVGVAATVNVDGPQITAGWNVGRVYVSAGSMFETQVIAGRAIGFIEIHGSIANDPFTPTIGTNIVAGDSIYAVGVVGNTSEAGNVSLVIIEAGATDLGADQMLMGTGANADTVKSGWINDVYFSGDAYAVVVTAGMRPGTDGIYNTGDDRVAPGVSFINVVTISGTAQYVSAFSDSFGIPLYNESRYFKAGPALQLADSRIWDGWSNPGTSITSTGLAFTNGSNTGTLYFAGPGEAYWNQSTQRITVVNGSLASALSVIVDGTNPTLNNFDIVTNDDCSIGAIYFNANLAGNSDIIVDAYVQSITVGTISGNGEFNIGGDFGTLNSGTFSGGTLTAKQTAYINITGDFGAANYSTRGEATLNLLAVGFVTITGADRGRVNAERDLYSFTVGGLMDGATVRAGSSLSDFKAGSVSRTWVSVNDFLGAVKVTGDVFDSSIMAGVDLGYDTEFGGTGINADRVSSGFMGDVAIGGNFYESDLIAGLIRGVDGFFGTTDDRIAEGRSTIGKVTIGGTGVGSTRESESYRIASTGTMGDIKIGGSTGSDFGNFKIDRRVLPPAPFQVTDLSVRDIAKVSTAKLVFNQSVDSSTLATGLSIYQVRGASGEQELRLINTVDYTIEYDAANNTAIVRFSQALTNRNLPEQAGVPGPGLYRFKLDSAIIRATLGRTYLDGNADGVLTSNDDYSDDNIVGDAGDKLTSERVTVSDPDTNQAVLTVDFYAPVNLNVLLDNNRTPDGLPDANRVFTLRGTIGDHQDNDSNYFRFAGDTDVYKITLQAGQLLRLGAITGSAFLTSVFLVDSTGADVTSAQALSLPVNSGDITSQTFEQNLLIRRTGTYYIVVGNPDPDAGYVFATPGVVPNPDIEPATIGDYTFTVEVFDDGDSGFRDSTDAGNGDKIVNAPAPISFAGVDTVFGTGDDLSSIAIGNFVFTLSLGADGLPNTSDDLVTGYNSAGSIVSTRTGAGLMTSTVDAAIGPAGHRGIPSDVFPDVDIFHLNNGLTVPTGSKVKITVKLSKAGGDLGSRSQTGLNNSFNTGTSQDFRGSVQFGVFDTSLSTGAGDAVLVASSSKFSPNGGAAGVISAGDNANYGFDANGDFYIEFLTPGRQVSNTTLDASYAVYLQGVFNTDYQIVVEQDASAATTTLTKRVQNFLIEVNGGTINWLEVAGQTTSLRKFDLSLLGYTGTVSGGQTIQDYVLTKIRTDLQATFNAAGLAVNVSMNPMDFEFQEFSTIYLSSTSDPVSLVFANANFGALLGLGGDAFLTTQPYGYSQKVDVLNADSSDDAVVFLPTIATLGYTPSQADIDNLASSLTAAIGRRAIELMGGRITSNYSSQATLLDLMGANSVVGVPGTGQSYTVSNQSRNLSDTSDSVEATNFFLGLENTRSLLSKFIEAR
ncbi:MAG: hypothetical protein U0638_07700 [Phycisphaerales bacterium]